MAEQLEKIQSELSLCEKVEDVFCNKLSDLYFATSLNFILLIKFTVFDANFVH